MMLREIGRHQHAIRYRMGARVMHGVIGRWQSPGTGSIITLRQENTRQTPVGPLVRNPVEPACVPPGHAVAVAVDKQVRLRGC